MPVTTIVVVLLLLAVGIEAIVRQRRGVSGWASFAGWALAGFLSGLATISFAIGLLVLPFAAIAIIAVSRFAVWPAFLGFVGGAGLVGVLVSALNFGEPSSPDYYSWLATGLALAAASVIAFAVMTATPGRRHSRPTT
jgi:hypothetical protein